MTEENETAMPAAEPEAERRPENGAGGARGDVPPKAPSRRTMLASTLLYSLSFFVLGLCLSTLGPALLSLSTQISEPLPRTSLAFTVRSVGYAAGSLLTGPLFGRFPGHLVLGISLVAAGGGTCAIPATRTLAALFCITVLQGIGMGAMDTGANAMIVWIWEDRVGPYMQSIHFMFAFGAALGPLLLRAFFKPIEGNTLTGDYSNAFYFIGALNIAIGLGLFLIRSPKPRQGLSPTTLEQAAEGEDAEKDEIVDAVPLENTRTVDNPRVFSQSAYAAHLRRRSRTISILTFLLFCLLFLYVGSETGYGGFITAYAVLALNMAEHDGQLLASIYWWAIAGGRFASIFVSMRFPPRQFLSASVGLSLAFIFALSIGTGIYQSVGVLWAFTVLFGLAMACIFPTAIALAETYWPIMSLHTMAFVVGGALGEVIIPLVISRFLGDPHDDSHQSGNYPNATMWTNLAACAGMCVVLVAIIFLGERMKREEIEVNERIEEMRETGIKAKEAEV